MNKPQHEGFITDEPVEPPPEVDTEALPVPEAPAEYEPPVETWPLKVRLLHKPIRDNKGQQLSEMTFRQPTGGDINRYGLPVRIDVNGDIMMDERKMMVMMTALSGVMTPFLETMDPRDWAACAYRLRNFFLPVLAAW